MDFQKLKLGDYLRLQGDSVVGACIERKTVNDLVGRYAKGDHLRQLRRLRGSALRWPSLLVEGDEKVADTSKAIPWGADGLSNGPQDTALRSSSDLLSFVAQVALDSRIFVLISTSPQDTLEILHSWTQVLQDLLRDLMEEDS